MSSMLTWGTCQTTRTNEPPARVHGSELERPVYFTNAQILR